MRDDAEYAALGLKPTFKKVDPPVGPADAASVISAAAERAPDDEALADPERRYSFAELDIAVEKAAQLFESIGIVAGDRVAASLINRCDLVIAFFAVLRLGAIWVGVNRILPAGDKSYILAHSGAKVILTDADTAADLIARHSEFPALSDILIVDRDATDRRWTVALDGPQPGPKTRPAIDPFAPAAIMYTSGTTGSPKGVVHSQHNMVTLVAAASAHNLMSPEVRRGAVLPLTITNVMILGPLLAFWNSKGFVCGQSVKTQALIEWIERENIGNLAAVPTMVYDLLESDLDLPEGFKMGCGGAPLPEPIRLAFLKRHGFHLQQSYGLTEAPTVVTESRHLEPPVGSSGLPLPHLHVTIRSVDGEMLPLGEVGEVCVSAVNKGPWAHVYAPSLGYWLDGEKTEALLRHNVLHTSDLGRFDADGWLHLADRSSELILRGGSNVYPAEIERVLHSHEGVADCAVVGKPDLRMGMKTVAFVQPAAGATAAESLTAELKELCSGRLVRYKVPDEWIVVESFPRNAMGKIVKPALRARLAEDPADNR
jgi:acyl-CoA synthetase (AMP-forming)/AMP-acid ligase II